MIPFQAVLITGAASGIARHLAGELAGLGHRVLASDLERERLERACSEDRWRERGQVELAQLGIPLAGVFRTLSMKNQARQHS
jgi:NAD(P)-dependent dehydrogenase (short-subunit alcohol dehydrogenase family)